MIVPQRGSNPHNRLPHPSNHLDDHRVRCDHHKRMSHRLAAVVSEIISIEAGQLDQRDKIEKIDQ